jgi:hypothetical protein
MPEFAVLIYASDSLHAPKATKEELKECDEHFDSLVATGRMHMAYALTPRDHARTIRAAGAPQTALMARAVTSSPGSTS